MRPPLRALRTIALAGLLLPPLPLVAARADTVVNLAVADDVDPARCAGTIAEGSYRRTHEADGACEVLREALVAVDPSVGPRARLRRAWDFEVAPGDSYVFRVRAHRDPDPAGDDFTFSYSVDGGRHYHPLLKVTRTEADAESGDAGDQTCPFPVDVAGKLKIRVDDTGRSTDDETLTALHVDHLAVLTRTGVPPDPAPAGPSRRLLVGYFPSWGIYARRYFVADIPARYLTHVHYAFAGLEPTGPEGTAPYEIVLGDRHADVERAFPGDDPALDYRGSFNQLRELKRVHPHLKAIISVGGWTRSRHFSPACRPEHRAAFVASVERWMREYGEAFDGVDIDWEYPTGEGAAGNRRDPENDPGNFVATIAALRAGLDRAGAEIGKPLSLSIATPGADDKIEGYRLAEHAPHLDYVLVMAYDFRGDFRGERHAHHHAPLFPDSRRLEPEWEGTPEERRIAERYNVAHAVAVHLREGVPASKLVLGIPFYGRAFKDLTDTVDVPENPGLFDRFEGVPRGTWDDDASGATGVFDYEDIRRNLEGRATRHWIADQQVPYLLLEAGPDEKPIFIGYDDRRSVALKARFALSKGLGGVMGWELSADREEYGTPESLLKTLFDVLNGRAE